MQLRTSQEAVDLWRSGLLWWGRLSSHTLEEMFQVEDVAVWHAQLDLDVVLDGPVRVAAGKEVSGLLPVTVCRGAHLFFRKDKRELFVEIEVPSRRPRGFCLWTRIDDAKFQEIAEKCKKEGPLRAGPRDPLRGEGVRRLEVYSRPRAPFL